MPQNVQTISSVAVDEANLSQETNTSNYSAQEDSRQDSHLSSVMSDLNRLSRSFVDSYQNLEGQVEQLNDQLLDASERRSEAIEEKQKLIDEKQAIDNRLQNLLAILPSGVVVLDGKGVVRDCNAVAIDILGRPLLGEAWVDVIRRTFDPQADDGHQISLKDGRKVHIETRALDSEPGQLIVLTDMTKTRLLQAELSQQQKLSSMGKMVASLAHQIRTPLSAALLYASHLSSDKLNEEKSSEFAGLLLERLNFMERQIGDMLNFVKGERKTKSEFCLSELVEAISINCKSTSHKIVLDVDSKLDLEAKITGDLDSLNGAISNLINNAVEASKERQAVTIALHMTETNQLVIAVTDTGVGINKSQQRDLFEPFYTTKSHGNGLGLSIVHGVVIDHQGSISVTSQKGKGSEFKITLPVSTNTEALVQQARHFANAESQVIEGASYGY
jgi:two-component system, sensor histidine kinase FlrB